MRGLCSKPGTPPHTHILFYLPEIVLPFLLSSLQISVPYSSFQAPSYKPPIPLKFSSYSQLEVVLLFQPPNTGFLKLSLLKMLSPSSLALGLRCISIPLLDCTVFKVGLCVCLLWEAAEATPARCSLTVLPHGVPVVERSQTPSHSSCSSASSQAWRWFMSDWRCLYPPWGREEESGYASQTPEHLGVRQREASPETDFQSEISLSHLFSHTSCFLSPLLGPSLSPSALARCSMLRNSSLHIPVSKCWELGSHSDLTSWPGVNVLHSPSVNSPEDSINNLKRKCSGLVKETVWDICEKARSWERGSHSSYRPCSPSSCDKRKLCATSTQSEGVTVGQTWIWSEKWNRWNTTPACVSPFTVDI